MRSDVERAPFKTQATMTIGQRGQLMLGSQRHLVEFESKHEAGRPLQACIQSRNQNDYKDLKPICNHLNRM